MMGQLYTQVVVYRNGQIEHVQETSEESTCVAVTPEGTEVALGGIEVSSCSAWYFF